MSGRWARFRLSLGAMSQRHAVGEGISHTRGGMFRSGVPTPSSEKKKARKQICAMEVHNGRGKKVHRVVRGRETGHESPMRRTKAQGKNQ